MTFLALTPLLLSPWGRVFCFLLGKSGRVKSLGYMTLCIIVVLVFMYYGPLFYIKHMTITISLLASLKQVTLAR